MNDFLWLQQWYNQHCDGDWEHGNGISISTIDNPGWRITIDLENTELKIKKFKPIDVQGIPATNWITCFVRNYKFEGACGPTNLTQILAVFREWVENHQEHK